MIVKLQTEHHLEYLSLKGGCRGSSESTLVKCQIVGKLMLRLISFVSNISQKVWIFCRKVYTCNLITFYLDSIKLTAFCPFLNFIWYII